MMASLTVKSAMGSSTAADEYIKNESDNKVAVVYKDDEESKKDLSTKCVQIFKELFLKFGLYTDRGKDLDDLIERFGNPAVVKDFTERALALVRKLVLTPGSPKEEDFNGNPNFLSEDSSDGRTKFLQPVREEVSVGVGGDSHEKVPIHKNAEDGGVTDESEALSPIKTLADGTSLRVLDQSSNQSTKAFSYDRLPPVPSREEVEDIKLRVSALEQSDEKRAEDLQQKYFEKSSELVDELKCSEEELRNEISLLKQKVHALQVELEKVKASNETRKKAQDDGHSAGPMFD